MSEEPMNTGVEEAAGGAGQVNDNPQGADWMSRGMDLFGKRKTRHTSLETHLKTVLMSNLAAFDIHTDKPPAAQGSNEELNTPNENKRVFCICRREKELKILHCSVYDEW